MPSPFFGTTSRYGLRKLLGTSNISDVDAGFAALADDIDGKLTGYSEGTHAGRPAAGTRGRLYYETDTGLVFFDNGAAWSTVILAGAWTSLSLAGGVSSPGVMSGSYVAASRPEGDGVRIKGTLVNASGGTITSGTTLATVTAAQRPSVALIFATVLVGGPTPSDVTISSAGAVTLNVNLPNASQVDLNGITYTLTG